MKTLATCNPTEFADQTVKIVELAEQWLRDTDIMSIRKTMPELVPITKESSKNDITENRRRMEEQTRKNVFRIIYSCLRDNRDETLSLLALACFVEPSHVNDYPVMDYINAVAEMLGNEAVINFFTSLARWGVAIT